MYIKCDKCGGEEFIRVFALVKSKEGRMEERKLVCYKCDDELTAIEINEQLGK